MQGLRGATVARLTPDQKVACSSHVGVKLSLFFLIEIRSYKTQNKEKMSPV